MMTPVLSLEGGLDAGGGEPGVSGEPNLSSASTTTPPPEVGARVIRAARHADEQILSVSDQGNGIPEEVREKVFNLYFSTKQRGSGIGLAMAFRVVQLHGGTIEFTSETGKGTTFWFRFPAYENSRDSVAEGAVGTG